MEDVQICHEAISAIKGFVLPQEISFGKVICPVMISCDYKDGKWGKLSLVPYKKIEIAPTSKVLHYAQEIFEGMKAYRSKKNEALLFRPEENEKRFAHSARRMAIPELPDAYFLDAVKCLTSFCSEFIPNGKGESLYIRPFIFATEESLGIKPSNAFTFMVIASPSGPYFQTDGLSVLIEREYIRACPGGTGSAKTGGNYASSLYSALRAQKLGYSQILWLDALSKQNIEELSGMNFFAVINNVLCTPFITETILNGITRNSLLTLAESIGLETSEEMMNINNLIEKILSGECSELFSCGTAAVITPIASLGEADGTLYKLSCELGTWSRKLKEELVSIQEGDKKGPKHWVVPVLAPRIEILERQEVS